MSLDAPPKRRPGRPLQTHCKRGHDLTNPANQAPHKFGRRCRICQNAFARASVKRRRERAKSLLQPEPDRVP